MIRLALTLFALITFTGCVAPADPWVDLRGCDDVPCGVEYDRRYRLVAHPGVASDDWSGWSAWLETSDGVLADLTLTSIGTDYVTVSGWEIAGAGIVAVYVSPEGDEYRSAPLVATAAPSR